MKKGEKRIGDYLVKVTKSVKCWFCGKTIKKGSICIRNYCGNYSVYWHSDKKKCHWKYGI